MLQCHNVIRSTGVQSKDHGRYECSWRHLFSHNGEQVPLRASAGLIQQLLQFWVQGSPWSIWSWVILMASQGSAAMPDSR